MPPPTRSLRCLERFVHLGAPLADWKREAGDGFAAIEPLLKETDRLASRWSRPGSPAMRIVEHDHGRAVAVCDEEVSDAIELTHADRILRRPCELQLRKRLCGVLGLHTSNEPAARLPGVLSIGEWRPRPPLSLRACLAVATTADHLAQIIVEMAPPVTKPLVLLTLTRSSWSVRSDALIAATKMALVPLDDVLDQIGAEWRLLPAWDHYVSPLVGGLPLAAPGSFENSADIHEQVRLLKELERCVIAALAEKHVIGVDASNQPGQALLAKWAGYAFDATFKAAVSSLVKARLLGNGRHHGRRGGYFLTTNGKQAADFLAKS